MNIEITKAVIILSDGMDKIIMYTNFPSPFNPNFSNEKLSLKFDATKDTGIDYIKKHFNVDTQIKNIRLENL